jgi:biopolymer transport protein ExbD
MSDLIPIDELQRERQFNLAPMVDFLFLLLTIFAALAVTGAALYDSDLSLVESPGNAATHAAVREPATLNISVTENGHYRWMEKGSLHPLASIAAVQERLLQEEQGKELTRENILVLLHIDKHARWEPIAQLILAIKQMGYTIHPVYEGK